MPVMAYLESHTRRQHRAHLQWLYMEMNRPSRADSYVMQLTSIVRCLPRWIWGEEAQPDTEGLKITFKPAIPEEPSEEAQAADAALPHPDDDPYWGQWKIPRKLTEQDVIEGNKRRLERRLERARKAREGGLPDRRLK